jgi:putative redox protein
VEISIRYEGDLRCRAVHGPSGSALQTDAPLDNQGRGEAFSPTDLVATALGACILTTMGIKARDMGVDMDGATIRVTKEMIADPHRRIHRLTSVVTMPRALGEKEQTILVRTARTCPVHRSLDARVEKPIDFVWPDG